MVESQHPRLYLQNFFSYHECKELEFIHKSCSTVGYRPNVFSTTLSHLIATNSAHLLMPFVPIRVCYLNNYGDDFNGGIFHFQDGDPATIIPSRGDVVIYTADSRNIHSVNEISEGERLTLALWFSRDSSHDEDAKLLSLLSESSLHSCEFNSWLPLPASSNMYWFFLGHASDDQSGFDICWARLHALGFDILYSQENSCYSDISELLMKPLQLARGDELFEAEFVNMLHALQVVQYYCWKASELETTTNAEQESSKVMLLSESQKQRICGLKSLFSKDDHLAETVFSRAAYGESMRLYFDWKKFVAVAAMWEDYVRTLHDRIVQSLRYWRKQQSIFLVAFDEN